MSAALIESGQRVKVRHSRYSRIRQAEAREVLAIVHTIADDFAAHLSQLAATTGTDRQWAAVPDGTGEPLDVGDSALRGEIRSLAALAQDGDHAAHLGERTGGLLFDDIQSVQSGIGTGGGHHPPSLRPVPTFGSKRILVSRRSYPRVVRGRRGDVNKERGG